MLQLVDTKRQYTDANDQSYGMQGGNLLDNAVDDKGDANDVERPIGMEITRNIIVENNIWRGYSWPQEKGEGNLNPLPYTDDVVIAHGQSNPKTSDKSVTVTYDRFRTYLMYKPSSGVWVPLSRINWEWKAHSYKDANGTWTLDPNLTSFDIEPAATPNPNNSSDLWPSYTGKTWTLEWEAE